VIQFKGKGKLGKGSLPLHLATMGATGGEVDLASTLPDFLLANQIWGRSARRCP
jgi:hypothetical protein